MAKELPYFKFYVGEWREGDITLEDFKTQGVFINICAYYWSQECDISFEKLQKRFKNNKKQLENLKKAKIIFSDGEQVVIKFLNKQWQEREVIKHRNKANGLKGGRPKITQSVNSGIPKDNPKLTNIEEKREEEKREEKELAIFDFFRKSYPGTKRGNETEFNNLKKKHADWKIVIPQLSQCLQDQKISRANAKANGLLGNGISQFWY